jgi:hypothetical protein
VSDLTTLEANSIVVYADKCLEVLNMKHWMVMLASKPTDHENAIASVDPTDGRYCAVIYVCSDWDDYPTDQKRSTILHECIHLTHHQLDDHLRNVLGNNTQLSEDLWHAVYTPFCKNLEYMVDHWTNTIRRAGLMPEWPTTKETRAYMRQYGIVEYDKG